MITKTTLFMDTLFAFRSTHRTNFDLNCMPCFIIFDHLCFVASICLFFVHPFAISLKCATYRNFEIRQYNVCCIADGENKNLGKEETQLLC